MMEEYYGKDDFAKAAMFAEQVLERRKQFTSDQSTREYWIPYTIYSVAKPLSQGIDCSEAVRKLSVEMSQIVFDDNYNKQWRDQIGVNPGVSWRDWYMIGILGETFRYFAFADPAVLKEHIKRFDGKLEDTSIQAVLLVEIANMKREGPQGFFSGYQRSASFQTKPTFHMPQTFEASIRMQREFEQRKKGTVESMTDDELREMLKDVPKYFKGVGGLIQNSEFHWFPTRFLTGYQIYSTQDEMKTILHRCVTSSGFMKDNPRFSFWQESLIPVFMRNEFDQEAMMLINNITNGTYRGRALSTYFSAKCSHRQDRNSHRYDNSEVFTEEQVESFRPFAKQVVDCACELSDAQERADALKALTQNFNDKLNALLISEIENRQLVN